MFVSTDTLEPPRDANGVAILPGYRPPFTSESARQARAKAEVNLKAERELYRKLGLHKQRRPRNLLYAVQKAIVKHCNFSCEPNLEDCGSGHARNAKLFTDIYLTLTGRNPVMVNQPKRGSKPHLAGLAVSPISPTITPSQNVSPLVNHSGLVEINSVTPGPTLESGNKTVNPTTPSPAPVQAEFRPSGDDAPF